MTRRETLLVIAVLVFAVCLTGAALVATSNKPEETKTNTAHDETNSDGHHDKSKSEPAGEAEDLTSQTQVSMDIVKYAYSKPNIKIKKGTTVTWTNQDSVKHSVMLDHNDSGSSHDAPTKDQVKSDVLAGPLLAKGESYSFTFNEVSSDPYHCSPHPYMKGKVTVVQ